MRSIYIGCMVLLSIGLVSSNALADVGVPCCTLYPYPDLPDCSGCAGTPHSGQVNISGATLFSAFFADGSSTQDYIDADQDGVASKYGIGPANLDQLAPSVYCPASDPPCGKDSNIYWHVIYRGVGSGNGLKELDLWHDINEDCEVGAPTDEAYINRQQYADGITPGGDYCATNTKQGGCPVIQNQIDLAVMDVPLRQFVVSGYVCNSDPERGPEHDGYGLCPIDNWDEGDVGTQKNYLKELVYTDPADIREAPIAWVSIGITANPGAAIDSTPGDGVPDGKITKDDLRHLWLTGRLPSGENLVAATRDSGSGTRNGAMSSICLDPSWGKGDNLAKKIDDSDTTKLGRRHQATNLGGSSRMKEANKNRRLSVGYNGLDDKAGPQFLAQEIELLNVEFVPNSGVYARPTWSANTGNSGGFNSIVNTDVDAGWKCGGSETFVWVDGAISCSAEQYLQNIQDSISAYVAAQTPPGSPGEYLALNFTLLPGMKAVPSDVYCTQACEWVLTDPNDPNQFNPNIYNDDPHDWNFPAYGYAGAGIVPFRLFDPCQYSDGMTQDYLAADGSTVLVGGTPLHASMTVQGDMDNDRDRDAVDLALMVANMPAAGVNSTYAPTGLSSVFDMEIACDMNGDGNLDAKDVRYYADGLILVGGMLNRAVGFTAVDTAAGGNYFGTSIQLGAYTKAVYVAGDSRGDVAGNPVAPGADPRGADGVVDDMDIDYMLDVLSGGWKADIKAEKVGCYCCTRWDDALLRSIDLTSDDAVWADDSLDMNGDRTLDVQDLMILVETIIGLPYGDLNADGVVDDLDAAIITGNFGMGADSCLDNPGYLDGDINGDGRVDEHDLDIACNLPGDIDVDCDVDLNDFSLLAENWLLP
ncbi:MAG: hypothetical protein JW860_05855 [Sedimentisphaerales bacterium]|nr:hypothetical protein [Sedimentisphaerales bacterium]